MRKQRREEAIRKQLIKRVIIKTEKDSLKGFLINDLVAVTITDIPIIKNKIKKTKGSFSILLPPE